MAIFSAASRWSSAWALLLNEVSAGAGNGIIDDGLGLLCGQAVTVGGYLVDLAGGVQLVVGK